ncbi:MAG: alkaline phosphatase D family protein [Myxococcota bacterium]
MTSRRTFLQAGASAVLLSACGRRRPTAEPLPPPPLTTQVIPLGTLQPDAVALNDPPEDADRFPSAVLAGAMRPTSVRLTTRFVGRDAVWLYVWAQNGPREVLISEPLVVDDAGYVRVSVVGLEPGRWYRYCFIEARGGVHQARSLIGRVRTAPAEDSLLPVTIALSACAGRTNAPWPALQATATQDYDLMLFLGDMAYNDPCRTLDEYRESWTWHLSGDGYRRALQRAGMYAIWDDHEVADNWNPETFPRDRLEAAVRAHREALPLDDGPLWRSYRWGRTAEIFLLDCRSERRPAQGKYMSDAQFAWLRRGLIDSPCQFRLIANSVPITNMPGLWDIADDDRWEGYPQQRLQLLDMLRQEGLEDVLFLAGDFHCNLVTRVEPGQPLREVVVTSGNTNPLAASLAQRRPDQFDYSVGAARAALLTLDPIRRTVEIRFHRPKDGGVDWRGVL